jgi:RNase P subunit RPR2
MPHKKLLIYMIFSILSIGNIHAESIYLMQMNQAQWDKSQFNETIDLLKESKPVELSSPLKVSPFHHQIEVNTEVKRDFCISCHTALPHAKSERLRSYLNMHVNHLACTSCHFQPEGIKLDYRKHEWVNVQPEKTGSKRFLVTPFSEQGIEAFDSEQPAIAELLRDWKENSTEQRARLHLQIHTPLKNEGLGCHDCHSAEQSKLDFAQLGYERDEIKSITNNPIARFLGDESFKDKPIKLIDLLQ